jgi:hypothetical protein
MTEPGVSTHKNTQGWESDTKIQTYIDSFVSESDAIALTITEVDDRYPELTGRSVPCEVITLLQSDRPSKRSPTRSDSPHSVVESRFQHHNVTEWYGCSVCVIID